MNAFAAALAVLMTDGNMSVPATLRAQGRGAPVPLRVVLSAPDAEAPLFGGDIIRPDAVIVARIADYPSPAKGDTIEAAGTLHTVRAWRRDAEGLTWTIEATR
jgi:hypothetical protein